MYLHLGQDTVVMTKELIGIFDIERTSTAKSTRNYMADAQKKGQVVDVAIELPKSYIIMGHKNKTKLYISPISPSTLKKRFNLFGVLPQNAAKGDPHMVEIP